MANKRSLGEDVWQTVTKMSQSEMEMSIVAVEVKRAAICALAEWKTLDLIENQGWVISYCMKTVLNAKYYPAVSGAQVLESLGVFTLDDVDLEKDLTSALLKNVPAHMLVTRMQEMVKIAGSRGITTQELYEEARLEELYWRSTFGKNRFSTWSGTFCRNMRMQMIVDTCVHMIEKWKTAKEEIYGILNRKITCWWAENKSKPRREASVVDVILGAEKDREKRWRSDESLGRDRPWTWGKWTLQYREDTTKSICAEVVRALVHPATATVCVELTTSPSK